MTNYVFIVGELSPDFYELVDKILEYYKKINNVKFIYCVYDENNYLSNNINLKENPETYYDYINTILLSEKYNFENNDNICINILPNLLFLNNPNFWDTLNEQSCVNGYNLFNSTSNEYNFKMNLEEAKIYTYDEIFKYNTFEEFLNLKNNILFQDSTFNGTYFKYFELKNFIKEYNNLTSEDKINKFILGDDVLIYTYINSKNIKENTIINGFVFILDYGKDLVKENNTFNEFCKDINSDCKKSNDESQEFINKQHLHLNELKTQLNKNYHKSLELNIISQEKFIKELENNLERMKLLKLNNEFKIKTGL